MILIGIIRNGCGSHCDLNSLELQGVVVVVLWNGRTPSLWNLDRPEKWGQANSAQLVIVFFLTGEQKKRLKFDMKMRKALHSMSDSSERRSTTCSNARRVRNNLQAIHWKNCIYGFYYLRRRSLLEVRESPCLRISLMRLQEQQSSRRTSGPRIRLAWKHLHMGPVGSC